MNKQVIIKIIATDIAVAGACFQCVERIYNHSFLGFITLALVFIFLNQQLKLIIALTQKQIIPPSAPKLKIVKEKTPKD